MRKIARIIMAIVLAIPMAIGTLFSTITNINLTNTANELAPETTGGGGYNSLKEKENDDNPQSGDDTGDSGESQVTTYTYKSYLDYFIDNMDCTGVYNTDGKLTGVTISADKEAEILSYDFTGNGTASDPYQINTTNGFWYMSSFVNLTNKYVELNCDVVLNDEKFDENGNASGGDGVVYDWNCSDYAEFDCFDGKNFKISGIYFNNNEISYFSLFKTRSTIACIQNLKINNFYINACEFVGTLCYRADVIRNVVVYNGKVVGQQQISGICVVVRYGYIEGCINYANVQANDYSAGGIVAYISDQVKIKNCINYGTIEGDRVYAGILGMVMGRHAEILNCINYGNIGGRDETAGIVAVVYEQSNSLVKITNCVNYGVMKATTGRRGNIIGTVAQNTIIQNCKCFGAMEKVYWGYNGDVVGSVRSNICLSIKDCDINSNTFKPIIGHISDGVCCISINNAYKYCKDEDNGSFTSLLEYANYEEKTKLSVENVVMDMNITNFSNIYFTSGKSNDTNIKNVIVKVNGEKISVAYKFMSKSNDIKVLNGVLINLISNVKEEKMYYGTNFRDFYVSWKHGTIGLKTLDGVGSAQGSVTTDWLEENGWVKKG